MHPESANDSSSALVRPASFPDSETVRQMIDDYTFWPDALWLFRRLCLAAAVGHELCHHRRQAGSAYDVFRARDTEMNPARVEPIDHFGARLGPAFRHALADEELRPLRTRDSNRFDGTSQSAAQRSCDIVGGILIGTGHLNIAAARPLLT